MLFDIFFICITCNNSENMLYFSKPQKETFMKYIALVVIIAVALLLASCSEQPALSEPEPAPEAVLAEAETDSLYFALPYEFSAVDIYGNALTAEALGEKRAFFLHLWATWCGPCVRGMPDMAEISRDYGDDVGFIGLLLDYDSNADGAVNIIESAGVPDWFIMIDANEPSAAPLLEIVRTGFVPSSAIITKDNHFPEPLSGRNYAEILDEILGY